MDKSIIINSVLHRLVFTFVFFSCFLGVFSAFWLFFHLECTIYGSEGVCLLLLLMSFSLSMKWKPLIQCLQQCTDRLTEEHRLVSEVLLVLDRQFLQ